MSLLNKIWNKSPKEVFQAFKGKFQAFKGKIAVSITKPKWTEVKSGPLKGGQLFLAPDLFEVWNEMINGRYDSFIYEEIERCCNIVGAVCWDIGAHFGYHSFSFASLVGENGQVYAFEPNPFNVARFKMHLEKNKTQAKRITLNTFAISDVDGEMTFVFSNDVDGRRSTGSHLQNVNPPLEAGVYNNFKTQTVKTLTIDSFINTPDARIPDIIKIDVEGAELLVLMGGKEFFKNHKPIIFMEVHNILMMFYVHKFLLEHGYSVHVLNENNSTPSRCFIMAHSV
jgi:FkbM family methyltransferase